ncbi:unnamed protein product [Brachionus calyciflorus]|uniref:SOCS box domain-containing protein n=1 Tax=Brachionus calyciflorus TaxID=104777 RepID=A0A814B630_9BILA|nr:unnamed protein product [Brachionus calyciflorus]
MSFLWHTALSVIDLSSSLLYNLLGRDLTENDIQLIELLFTYISNTELKKLFANKSQLNLSLNSNNSQTSNQLTVNDLEKCLEYDSKQISNLINLLLTSIDSFRSKDLLLITNKQNGYNIIQTLIQCILQFSFNILTQNYKLFSEKNSNNIENDFDHIIQQRINLLKILLHNYSCDPNRGLLLSNKTRYCVNITNELVIDFFLRPKSTNKIRHKYRDFNENKSFHSNNVLINFDIDTSDEETQNNTNIDRTKIESETLSEITVETIIKNKNSPTNCQKTTNLRPSSPCSYITNVDLSLITNYSDEKSISQLTNLPIDTPLLLICCVYNSNNLLSLSNLNKSKKSNKPRRTMTPQIPLINLSQKRRNTIQIDSIPEKPFRLSRSNSVKSVNNNENSELYSLWSSSSSSVTKTRSSSDSFSTESSLSFDSLDSSEFSPYTKSVDSISKLFKSSSKLNKNQNFDECQKSESELSDNYNPIISNTESQYSDENQSDSDSDDDDDSSLNSSNIYDYEEKDEENYYDKYDYDFNSACYKTDSSSSYFDSYRQPRNSLSTSVHSLISSSNENSKNLNFKSTTCSIRSNLSNNKNNFIYEKLNELRLKLVDLLLTSGADKYLISKLTLNNMKQMNRKSKMMLKKWYGMSRFESNVSEGYTETDVDSDPDSDSCELRPLSPIMASLCLDDVDIFSRLYKHQQNLFNYFKPDEDYELIYYAIKFQAKNCLVYLLSNLDSENLPTLFETNTEKRIPNKNVNTMFYILENTRSSKIIKVLLNCGFDLTKREPLTGNTSLHCLFNANTSNNKYSRSKKVLSEYNDPKSLSRILFLLLKKGGLKTHVNTLNNERKLCIQSLFEWDELIETVFFKDSNNSNRNEWKKEFKECVRLLLKSGSDLLLNINNNELELEGYSNCIETLLNSLLKHSILCQKNIRTNRSPSVSNILKTQQTTDPRLSPRAKKFTQQKTLDIEYLDHILNEIIDLNSVSVGLSKTNLYTNSTNSTNPDSVHRLPPRDCSIEKFLELLLNTHIDDFSSAYTTFKSLLNFQKCLNNKLRLKFQSFNLFKQQSKFINPHLIKRLLTNWILYPNFLNSSNQFEKNNFIKMILIELIRNNLYDPNDSTSQVHQSTDLIIQSNNLLNHCVQLIFLSKTCYQLELIYDLMRSLIQYGANPNLEPFNLNTSNNFRYKVSNSILAQLCDPFLTERPSPILTGVNLSRPRRNSYKNEDLEYSNYNHHHQHNHHHSHHNYFDDYFRDKKFAPINNDFHHHNHNHHVQINEKDNERRSPDNLKTSNNGRKILSSNPICLLTPSPSYSSLINLNAGIISNSVKSNNIVIDSSILFLNYYKRYVKLLFDSMENERISEVLKSRNIRVELSNGGFCTHHNHYHHHNYHRSGYHLKSGQKVYAIESLDMYLERLVASPRSLKSLCRRSILNRLSETQKLQNDLNNDNGLVQVASQIEDFNLPKRVKNYLLFIE